MNIKRSLLSLLVAAPALMAQPVKQPNIILFLVDDMGWQDTSVPFAEQTTPFNQHFQTPNMEALAEQGVKFTQAYSHSVCTPSRVSLMTGQNPARHHVTNWTKLPDVEHSGTWGPNGPPTNWRKEGIQQQDVTLANTLQKAGYYTIHVGKAHFGALGTSGALPQNLGFDVNIAGHAAGAPASYYGELDYGNKLPVVGGYPQAVPGLEKYHQSSINLTDVLTIEAKKAITEATKTDKPFFMNMAHYAIHTPIEAHKKWMKLYQNRTYKNTDIDIPDIEEKYASLVTGMDSSLGELMDHLNDLGIAEDTLIIFTSDNGGLSGHTRQTSPMGTELNTHNWPLHSGKGSAYEGGTRVPYIVAWGKPNDNNPLQQQIKVAQNEQSEQVVIIEDLFPTLIGLAGGKDKLPQEHKTDGIDTKEYWSQVDRNDHRTLVFHYPHVWGPHGPGYQPHSAMRMGDWKVIYYYNSQQWELYNLSADLSEKENLAQRFPKKLSELANELNSQLLAKQAQWPVNRVTGKEAKLVMPH